MFTYVCCLWLLCFMYCCFDAAGSLEPGGLPRERAEGRREDQEQEAEDFAALLIFRLGRLPSDRSSIVQVRLGEAFG